MRFITAATAAALALTASFPARASSGDDSFAASAGLVRDLVARDMDTVKNPELLRRATHESGPNDPLYTTQKWIGVIAKDEPSVVMLTLVVPKASPIADDGDSSSDAAAPAKPAARREVECTGFFVNSSKYLSREGLIATNAHCVQMRDVGSEIEVGLYDGDDNRPRMTKGRILAYGDANAAKDLALVELEDQSLNRRPLPLWWKIDQGEDVPAIGNPQGLTFSVSQGIVSAIGRDRVASELALDMNQSDVAINPGNSGGPLFNRWGDVIGINTLLLSRSGGSEGIAFSIPANFVGEALKQYARTGDLKVGALRVKLGPDADGRLAIASVAAGGPGEAAGLRAGDEIARIADRSGAVDFSSLPSDAAKMAFLAHVKYLSPGETTTLTVVRGGQELQVEATVGSPAPAQPAEINL